MLTRIQTATKKTKNSSNSNSNSNSSNNAALFGAAKPTAMDYVSTMSSYFVVLLSISRLLFDLTTVTSLFFLWMLIFVSLSFCILREIQQRYSIYDI